MKNVKLIIVSTLFLVLINSFAFSQETTEESTNPFSASCDLMSRYVWRGIDFGGSPSIQPGIEYSKNGFAFGAWGAFATNFTGAQEADLYAAYTFNEKFSITFTDYFFPDETADYKYFELHEASTGHVFETTLAFNGTEKLPLSVLIAANVWGADARKINTDGTTGSIQYSTYGQLAYSFKNLSVFIGFNLTNPDENKGESGFYGDNYGITNLGFTSTKEIKITDEYKLPLSVSLITNPQAEKIYMVAGISF